MWERNDSSRTWYTMLQLSWARSYPLCQHHLPRCIPVPKLAKKSSEDHSVMQICEVTPTLCEKYFYNLNWSLKKTSADTELILVLVAVKGKDTDRKLKCWEKNCLCCDTIYAVNSSDSIAKISFVSSRVETPQKSLLALVKLLPGNLDLQTRGEDYSC